MKYLLFLLAFAYTTLSYSQNQPPPGAGNVEPKVGEVPVLIAPQIFKVVEQMPQYPGGEEAMMKFIQKNIHYPDLERESDIQGRVVVGFVVNEDGSLSDIQVKKSVSPGIDKEAVRVIRLMPKFIPGKQQGKAVRVQYMVPILFKLASPEPVKTKQ